MDSPSHADQSLETLQDIKRMMERSSRFISLSGLSGVCAGICALVGAFIAHIWIYEYYGGDTSGYLDRYGYTVKGQHDLKWKLIFLGVGVLVAALLTSTWFTWRRARRSNIPVWDRTTKKLIINVCIPLATGGIFVLAMIARSDWEFVAPSCLAFYGLALVNASKYTLSDIRYLGILEILLGCLNLNYPHWGLYFWSVGFGVLHVVYGLIMWWKYEREAQ